MGKVVDITPNHDPMGLARDMVKAVEKEGIVAGFYVLLTEEGDLIYDGAAYHKKDLLWALERTKQNLLGGG